METLLAFGLGAFFYGVFTSFGAENVIFFTFLV